MDAKPEQDSYFWKDPAFWGSLAVLLLGAVYHARLIPVDLIVGQIKLAPFVAAILPVLAAHGYDGRRAALKLEGLAKAEKPWWKRTETIITLAASLLALVPVATGQAGTETAIAAVLVMLRTAGLVRNAGAVAAAVADPTKPEVQ